MSNGCIVPSPLDIPGRQRPGMSKFLRGTRMAKIKTTSLLAEIRGALGGVVFSSNGSGFYAKQLVLPVQPRTPAQTAHRAVFSDAVRQYGTMTAPQIAAWIAYAADPTNTRYDYFGDPYLPSAINQYAAVNMLRAAAGLARTNTAPTGAIPAALPNMSVFVDFIPSPGNSTITNLAVFPVSTAYVHVLGQIWTSQGKLQPRLPLKFMAIIPKASFPNYDIQALLVSLFGTLPPDGRWYIALAPVSTTFRVGVSKTYTGRSGDTVTG